MKTVLDKGYVKLISYTQEGDLSIVNSARTSFATSKKELDEKDKKLIKYLIDHHHVSTLRHCFFTFEVKAPLFVCRQWWKHQIGSGLTEAEIGDRHLVGWNETSRRYTDFEPEFYLPPQMRGRAKSNKQGSIGTIDFENDLVLEHYKNSLDLYNQLLKENVAPELARIVLPQSIYTNFWWSISLNGLIHFLELRLDNHAQFEIQEYARAIFELVQNTGSIDFILNSFNKNENL